MRFAPVPPGDRRPEPAVTEWARPGEARPRVPPPGLRGGRELGWWRPLPGTFVEDPEEERRDTGLPPREGRRPAWFPARAVVDGTRAFVSDGGHLEVWNLETGTRAAPPLPLADRYGQALGPKTAGSAREDLGLLEGHALTLGTGGRRSAVGLRGGARADGRRVLVGLRPARDDRLEAFTWDGEALDAA